MSTPQRALQRQPQQLRFRKVESVEEDLSRMREAIAGRAYEIFDRRDGVGGNETEDWLAAERELLWEPQIELSEDHGTLVLQVAMAGFKPDEFDVQVTPQDVLIQAEGLPAEPDDTVTVHVSEFRQGRLFRDVRLPTPIEVDRAEARYRYGLLTITAPLADPVPVDEESVEDFSAEAVQAETVPSRNPEE